MRLRIKGYRGAYSVLSLALDEETRDELLGECVDILYVRHDCVVMYPEGCILTQDENISGKLLTCNNYDVFELYEDGTLTRYYDDSVNENVFFITGSCNSNCIFCPSPDSSRKRGDRPRIDDLIKIASHIPSDVTHITITGGEPFMAGREIFRFLHYLKEKFTETEFQILTNGRIFAIREYCELLCESLPNHSIIGIPLHGSCDRIHDGITRTAGSFCQTILGIKRLQAIGIVTEIRIVVCRENADDIGNIARLIADDLKRVNHVSIMAMEMTGNAFVNADRLWIPYRESFECLIPAINGLMEASIDVRLYNFPLCTVRKEYRTLCAKSISSWKVRFDEVCDHCRLKSACGGVFSGSMRFERGDLRAL